MSKHDAIAELTETELRSVWGAERDFFHDLGYSIGYVAGEVVDFVEEHITGDLD